MPDDRFHQFEGFHNLVAQVDRRFRLGLMPRDFGRNVDAELQAFLEAAIFIGAALLGLRRWRDDAEFRIEWIRVSLRS